MREYVVAVLKLTKKSRKLKLILLTYNLSLYKLAKKLIIL